MIEGIVVILAAVMPLIVALIERRLNRDLTEERDKEIDNAIARRDPAPLEHLRERLRRRRAENAARQHNNDT